jgi:hypothetical protein
VPAATAIQVPTRNARDARERAFTLGLQKLPTLRPGPLDGSRRGTPVAILRRMLMRTALWVLLGALVGLLVSLPFRIEGEPRIVFHLAMSAMGALVSLFVQTGAKAIALGRARRREAMARRAASSR